MDNPYSYQWYRSAIFDSRLYAVGLYPGEYITMVDALMLVLKGPNE